MKTTKPLIATMLAGALLATATPAIASVPDQSDTAQSIELSSGQAQELQEEMQSNGVLPSDQGPLLEGLEAGVLPEADRPGEVEPVSVEEIVDGDSTEVRSTYSDGSIGILTVSGGEHTTDTASGVIQTRAAAPITYVKGARIAYDGISFAYSFKANYHYRKTTRITKVSQAVVHRAIGHSISGKSLRVITEKSTSKSNPAMAQFSFDMTAFNVLWSRTVTLTLKGHGSWSNVSTNL
ncbi:hypothetical protein [Leucobacter luti]|uniref:Uncharacterized protein n=1 Tax=Leucobacter luti TaxID=340320 RepID=A0A4Q7U3F2_9MICO|nr:hypothetical protein [Leucobacter luti]RZT66722.1 hypothetical protein EV139_0849 [Leucobacter luti]